MRLFSVSIHFNSPERRGDNDIFHPALKVSPLDQVTTQIVENNLTHSLCALARSDQHPTYLAQIPSSP